MTKRKVLCPLFGLNIQHPYFYKTKRSPSQIKKDYDDREIQLRNGIELVDGINIRRISDEDIKLLQPKLYFYARLFSQMFILEKHFSVDDKFANSETMIDIVTALRLFQGGYVCGSEAIYFIETEKGDFRFSGSRISESSGRREHYPFYTLNFDDFAPLKNLIHRIQQAKIKERKHFHLAVKRFEHSYESTDIDDKLIDLMIAFEILFLKGENIRAPTGVVMGVGCSMLLGETEEEREEINQVLTKAYSIRNKIVHGGTYQEPIQADKEYSIGEFVGKVEDYLREAIKKLL